MYYKKTNLYEREFSEIRGLQQKSIIFYYIITTHVGNGVFYGIEVVQNSETEQISFIKESISDLEVKVSGLLKFLYENSVQVCSCESIVLDFLRTIEDL